MTGATPQFNSVGICVSADLSDYLAQQTFRKTQFLRAQWAPLRTSYTTKYSDGLILVTDASRDYR